MSKQAFIFINSPGTAIEYRVIVKTDGVRTDDKRFTGKTQQHAAGQCLAFLEKSGISERFVCDARNFNADTI